MKQELHLHNTRNKVGQFFASQRSIVRSTHSLTITGSSGPSLQNVTEKFVGSAQLYIAGPCRSLAWWYTMGSQGHLVSTRNSSGDEIANVNFLYGDIVHTLQNTTDSCINSATDRRSYVLEHGFTKFSEITQCNRHYAVRGHSKSPILVPIESSYTTYY